MRERAGGTVRVCKERTRTAGEDAPSKIAFSEGVVRRAAATTAERGLHVERGYEGRDGGGRAGERDASCIGFHACRSVPSGDHFNAASSPPATASATLPAGQVSVRGAKAEEGKY